VVNFLDSITVKSYNDSFALLQGEGNSKHRILLTQGNIYLTAGQVLLKV